MILPRLETFFLEEWIQHNLEFGVDQIYIYDQGLDVEHIMRPSIGTPRPLREEEKGVKWVKKPDADYFLDYSDEQIYEKLNYIVDKYKDSVKLVKWRPGIESVEIEARRAQTSGYNRCIAENPSDWWVYYDPDEFMYSSRYSSLKQLLTDLDKVGVNTVHMAQRVFERRSRDQPIKHLNKWAYEAFDIKKSIVKCPFVPFPTEKISSIHRTFSQTGARLEIPLDVLRFNHYRGDAAGKRHQKQLETTGFDKIDDSMRTFMR